MNQFKVFNVRQHPGLFHVLELTTRSITSIFLILEFGIAVIFMCLKVTQPILPAPLRFA